MRLLVVQHDHVSPPGPVAERFEQHGYEPELHTVVPEDRFSSPSVESLFPQFTAYDAVVVLGAVWSTYDHELIGSWVLPELEQLRQADRAGVPVFGICFGGQLLAAAHGGAVAASSAPELGWVDIESDDQTLVPGGRWFGWHSDSWQVPAGAREVARNAAASQAFVMRRNLAVQFHPELTSAMLAGWLGNGGEGAVRRFGLDPALLVEQAVTHDEEARDRAHRLVDCFVEQVAARRLPVLG